MGVPTALLQMKLIYSFHVPLFFVLSGVVYKEKNMKFLDFMKRQFVRRFVPFLVFNLALMLLWGAKALIISKTPWPEVASVCVSRTLRGVCQGRPSWNIVTWFLICLMIVEIWQFFLRKSTRTNRKLLISVVCFAVLTVVLDYLSNTNNYIIDIVQKYWYWWSVKPAVSAMFFYQFGIILRRTTLFSTAITRSKLFLSALLFSILTLALFDLNQTFPSEWPIVMVFTAQYGNLYLYFLTGLSGTLAVIYTSHIVCSKKLLLWIGRATIPLLGLNYIVCSHTFAVQTIFNEYSLFQNGFSLVLVGSLYTIASVIACVPFVWFLRKHMPFAIGQQA